MTMKQKAFVYYLIAMYVLYMVYQIAKNKYMGDATFSMPVAVGICSVMAVISLVIILYATRILIKEKKKQEMQETEEEV